MTKLSFSGKMYLYLNADSMEEMLEKSEFEGDWKFKRRQILKKPRYYFINLYLRVMTYDWDSRIWSPISTLHPFSVRICNLPSRGKQLHLKYKTRTKVDSEGLWISMRKGIMSMLDVEQERQDYIDQLVEAFTSLMGDNLKTQMLIQDEIDKLPDGEVIVDMDETYATVRC